MHKSVSFVLAAAAVLALADPGSARGQGRVFVAHLDGPGEVPPVDTQAQGQVVFRLAGDALQHRLNVAHIEDVVAAHVHCAPEGVNGPIGVTLFSGGPVTLNGTLSAGPITGPDPGNGCGWTDLDDIVDAMRSGDTYVNVHTAAHPGGEIRGQLR